MQFAWGYAPPLIIEAGLHYRLFDLLDKSPRTVNELAAQTGASARGLTAVLEALVGLELLARAGDRYRLTPESATFLVSTKPAFHGAFFRHGAEKLLPRWMQLKEIVRTGKPSAAFNRDDEGEAFFAEFVESRYFRSATRQREKLGEHLGLANATKPVTVLDVGAGSGVWGIALAQQSPLVRVRAVDWPRVLTVTERVARRCGVADRLTSIPGDFKTADWGTGHQVATFGHILHSEGREGSRALLRKAFDALAPGGTVAIMEFLVADDRTGPPSALIFAVNMLVHTETGDAFTFPEISEWLRDAGFVNPRLFEVPAVSPLVLATRP
jgi:predicted O-methyltransferase YrrM